ncbi:MAG: hypothetical protein P0Y58_11005 [Candidatus Pseudomonas phytovorans]|uniref:DUF6708 domain-containing protein n=1 Tax=Candidatus Pseudomonas phytovorans TaxID=3121377 RepID=A0AAJ6BCM5_9PSED|nr:DUF6708 domain-containing protein [Pseudomonas sp.]WEK32690.1 MAG: hypothetical protein P0Y58_11005 [Pseudomonas sp.]
MPGPHLNPPCTSWKEDLPHPDTPATIEPSLGYLGANQQNLIYLEVPRTIGWAREIMPLFSLSSFAFTACLPTAIKFSFEYQDFEFAFISMLLLACGIWASTFFLRVSISPPRDEPLRFNRARKKIYAYNFKYCWWNPFTTWKVETVCYDWSQVRAERWSQTVAISKWGVMLSIVAPGTNNVIDRFPLVTMGANQHVWAYICTYMQQGPAALPPPGEPKDHNDVLWCEFALRLAPKVQWPTEMDLESRTAP